MLTDTLLTNFDIVHPISRSPSGRCREYERGHRVVQYGERKIRGRANRLPTWCWRSPGEACAELRCKRFGSLHSIGDGANPVLVVQDPVGSEDRERRAHGFRILARRRLL